MNNSSFHFKKFFICFLLLILAGCSRTSSSKPTANLWTQWPVLPADSLANATQIDIATQLYTQYLNQFTQSSAGDSLRLKEFRIQKVDLPADFQACAADLGVEMIAEIQYGVLPVLLANPDWSAGSGAPDPTTGWINDKVAVLAIYRTGGSFTFKTLGAPPCAGITIDGSQVQGQK